MYFNKNIWKLKIAISSDCTLRCRHCFINKNANIIIDVNAVKNVIDLFLSIPPSSKKIEIYGGEPFLHFDIVKELVDYSIENARKKNIKLTCDIATNATYIKEEFLDYIKRKKNLRIAISIFGTPLSHNITRVFPDMEGSFDVVVGNTKHIFEILDRYLITATLCVYPKRIKYLFEDFLGLYNIGFRIFNIECVNGVKWNDEDFLELENGIKKTERFLEEKILSKDEIVFFETFIPFILKEYNDSLCPFYNDFEIYPDGTFGFYPYAFLKNDNDRQKIVIGNIYEGLKRFKDCKFNPESEICIDCRKNYYILKGYEYGNRAYNIRTTLLRNIFIKILKDERNKEYVKRVVEIIKRYY